MKIPKCVDKAIAGCGEGPLWDARRECLWWVDIAGETLHRYEPRIKAACRLPMPYLVSALAMRVDGELLMATAHGIGVLDQQAGKIRILHDPEPGVEGNRLNDMVVGPDGELWAGTMSEGARGATGALYRYGPGGIETMMSNTTISNGLDFSHDGQRLYFIDSVPGRLHVYEMGQWGILKYFDSHIGKPDGLAVDTEGTLWIAICDRGRVIAVAPDGKLIDQIEIPCETVTSCAFGGADLQTLYVTTGTFTLSPEERVANPSAGGLFAINMDVPGRTPFECQWPEG